MIEWVIIIVGITLALLIALGFMAFFEFRNIEERLNMVAASIEALEKEIHRVGTVHEATIVLLKDMHERLEELAKHPDAAKIKELAQQLQAHTDALAHAISDHDE